MKAYTGNNYQRTRGLPKLILSIVLLALSLICLYPVLYVIFASFSEPKRLFSHSGLLLHPLGFTLQGYKTAMGYGSILSGYRNTIFIVFVGTAVNMILTIFGAYGLSRKGIMLKRPIMLMIIFSMYFSGGMIPGFLTVKALGLIDSLWSQILPTCISAFNLIVLRTAMLGVPESLEESAKLDGASDFTVMLQIILPLVKASLAVVTLYYLVGHWNAWFDAMLYLRTRDKYPLQLVLREILISNSNSATSAVGFNPAEADYYKELIKYTTTVIATLPILFVYPFLQKYFVNGVMVGSVKG